MTTDPMLNIAVHDIHQGPIKAWLSRDDHFWMSTEGFDLVDWWAVHRSIIREREIVSSTINGDFFRYSCIVCHFLY
jgi:hypothetical protein